MGGNYSWGCDTMRLQFGGLEIGAGPNIERKYQSKNNEENKSQEEIRQITREIRVGRCGGRTPCERNLRQLSTTKNKKKICFRVAMSPGRVSTMSYRGGNTETNRQSRPECMTASRWDEATVRALGPRFYCVAYPHTQRQRTPEMCHGLHKVL